MYYTIPTPPPNKIKKAYLTNVVLWLNDTVRFSHKWELGFESNPHMLKVEIRRQALEVNWPKLHDPLTETHISQIWKRGYLRWMEYVLSGGIYAKDIASPKPIEKALLEWEMKWFKISFGSLGFKEEFNEAGLFSSWGGCTNSLLNIPNIFLTVMFFPSLLCFQNIIPLKTHRDLNQKYNITSKQT